MREWLLDCVEHWRERDLLYRFAEDRLEQAFPR
ncbi:unnamed protein product, partial [Rotaria sp. Silwood2]